MYLNMHVPQTTKFIIMLEHQKKVIENLSYDKGLFTKELLKSSKWLKVSELNKLFHWLRQKYWSTHKDEIVLVWQTI